MKEPQDMGPEDEALVARAKQLFDESVGDLDANSRSRLNRGRQAALGELNKRRFRPGVSQWLPAAGVAAVAVVAVMLWSRDPAVVEMAPPASASDFEIILQEDSFEMLEDLEFYSWMDLDSDADIAAQGSNVG